MFPSHTGMLKSHSIKLLNLENELKPNSQTPPKITCKPSRFQLIMTSTNHDVF